MSRTSLSLTLLALLAACQSATGPAASRDPFTVVYVQPYFDSGPRLDTVYVSITTHAYAVAGSPDSGSVPPSETIVLPDRACYQAFNGNNSRGVQLRFSVSMARVQRNGLGGWDTLAVYQSDTLNPFPAVIPFPAPWGLQADHPLIYKLQATLWSSMAWAADTLVIRSSTDANTACDKLF